MPTAQTEGRRSAFAAAFFSLLFPGLGQAYAGFYGRALAWAALPILVIALVAGIWFNSDEEARTLLLARFADPSVLRLVLVAIAFDAVYRLAALLDAYRLASGRAPARSAPALRILSLAGLLAIVLVLGVSHVAVARPVLLVYEFLNSFQQGTGGDEDDLGTPPPDVLFTPPPSPSPTAPPSVEGTPGAPTPVPVTAPPSPSPTPTATPTQGPPWNGRERLNILLIGADRREGYGGYLTDTLIVLTIDPVTKRAALLSLPRDSAGVPLPRNWAAYNVYGGRFGGKINTLYTTARYSPAYFPGDNRTRGYTALKGALGELYQLDIKYYVAVDIPGFRDVIDALGGVVVDVQVPVSDDQYPSEDERGALNLYIPPGIRHMDGDLALAYARARHKSSDFDRAQRQQRVLTSVRQQVDLSSLLAPGRLEQLFTAFKRMIKTDIPPDLFDDLVGLAQQIDTTQMNRLVFTPPTYATECWPCPSGLYELRINATAIREAVREALAGAPGAARREKLQAENATVWVLNGSGTEGQATSASEFLRRRGANAVVPEENGGRADRSNYTQTVITVYNGVEAEIPETIAFLEQTFGVRAAKKSDPSVEADVVVITGTATPDLPRPGG